MLLSSFKRYSMLSYNKTEKEMIESGSKLKYCELHYVMEYVKEKPHWIVVVKRLLRETVSSTHLFF